VGRKLFVVLLSEVASPVEELKEALNLSIFKGGEAEKVIDSELSVSIEGSNVGEMSI
jgi:hypothetical protein